MFAAFLSFSIICLVKTQQKDFMYNSLDMVSCDPKPTISCTTSKYYSADGSCNNLKVPWIGKANTPYVRLLPSEYDDNISALKTKSSRNNVKLPSVEDVALQVHFPTPEPTKIRIKKFSYFLTIFGQFITLDFTKIGTFPRQCKCSNPIEDCANIPLKKNPNQKCVNFVRTTPSDKFFDCEFQAKQPLNTVTHWLDLSPIYGIAENNSGIIDRNGLFKVSKINGFNENEFLMKADKGTCPKDTDNFKCFKTGDPRVNENMPMTSLFVLFMREHNRIARELTRINIKWQRDKIYEETRRILIGIYQNIIYKEYLPALLGRKNIRDHRLNVLRRGFSMSYDDNLNPQLSLEFSVAAFRFGHSMIPQIVHKTNPSYKKFLSISIRDLLFDPKQAYVSQGLDSFIFGSLVDVSSQMDSHLVDAMQNQLVLTSLNNETKQSSLSMINIQRGRDVGLPSYNKLRELCGLGKVRSFNRATSIFLRYSIRDLRRAYRNNPNDIDAWTGLISERHTKGAGLGAVTSCLLARQFFNLKNGDRLYYEHGHDKETRFLLKQLNAIREQTFSHLICNNYDVIRVLKHTMMPHDSRTNSFVMCKNFQPLDLNLWRE